MASISIRIDGEYIKAEEGTSILEAAWESGRRIPSLCYMKGLSPVGACRLCMVEVAGVNRLLPACTTPAEDGMSVTTNSARLKDYRRMVLELLFVERNHVCAVCVSNNHCELQALAQQLGVTRASGAEDLVLRQNANWRYKLKGIETGSVMYTGWNRSVQRMADPGGGYLQRVVVSVEMPGGRKESFMTYVARQ